MPNKMGRFTQTARRVLSLAQEEAERQEHKQIDTEHLLLGLLRAEGGAAAQVLSNLQIELLQVESVIRDLTQDKPKGLGNSLDLSAHSRKVLELSVDEARRMGHNHIGSEHLLLGLVRLESCIAIDVLRHLKVSVAALRRQAVAVMQSHAEATPIPRTPPPARQPGTREIELLLMRVSDCTGAVNHFTIDLPSGVKLALEAAVDTLASNDTLYLRERTLLLSLLGDPASLISRALLEMGVDRETLLHKLRAAPDD